MMNNLASSFFLFQEIFLAIFVVVVMAWLSIRLAVTLKLIDYPGSAPHKQHTRPTPLAGGIALLGSLLITEWVFGTFADPNVRATFLAAIVIFLFGLWDDYKNIPPLVKLAGQAGAAVLLVYLGVSIQIFESPQFFIRTSPEAARYLDWILTILWMVGITNAFNFVDSMDGLAVGLGGLAAAFFMIVTLDASQPLLSRHSALIFGACIGLYLFNSPPAMLFLGDSGSQTLGFALSALAIAYSPQGANQSSPWFVPILLLGIPIFDTALIVFSRLRRRHPIYSASRDHTYHRLLNMGLGSFRSVVVMQVAALTLSCLAFILLSQPPLTANFGFGVILTISLITILWLDGKEDWL
jgi:UDP-GlcNAc:undecaprenyl-phosphate/decaprenyl-phosphate GlcNAc-1-phosphate transferase